MIALIIIQLLFVFFCLVKICERLDKIIELLKSVNGEDSK